MWGGRDGAGLQGWVLVLLGMEGGGAGDPSWGHRGDGTPLLGATMGMEGLGWATRWMGTPFGGHHGDGNPLLCHHGDGDPFWGHHRDGDPLGATTGMEGLGWVTRWMGTPPLPPL